MWVKVLEIRVLVFFCFDDLEIFSKIGGENKRFVSEK